jgi:hypothetical protein
MAFPAGSLPNPGEVADFCASRQAPSRTKLFTHGGADLDLTDPANGLRPCATEFIVTSTAGGTSLIAQLAGDSVPRTYTVAVGQVVKGLFVLIKGTSTCDGVARQ